MQFFYMWLQQTPTAHLFPSQFVQLMVIIVAFFNQYLDLDKMKIYINDKTTHHD